MKISNFKRIVRENFPKEDQDLIDGIGLSINSFAEDVVRALGGNLNDDNINNKTKSLDVTVLTTGVPKIITEFKTGIVGKLEGIQVIKAENLTNSKTYPTGAPFITYTENGDLVRIQHITGLIANNKYRLKLKLFGS